MSSFNFDFLNVQAEKKIFCQPPGEVVGIILFKFEFSISFGLRGGTRFASRPFPKAVILASCNFVVWPFVACYIYAFVYFLSSY